MPSQPSQDHKNQGSKNHQGGWFQTDDDRGQNAPAGQDPRRHGERPPAKSARKKDTLNILEILFGDW